MDKSQSTGTSGKSLELPFLSLNLLDSVALPSSSVVSNLKFKSRGDRRSHRKGPKPHHLPLKKCIKGRKGGGSGRSAHKRAYWDLLLESARLSEEEKTLVQLRQKDHLPWKDVLHRFNQRWDKSMQQSALLMRMTRLTSRMDRAQRNHEFDCYSCPYSPNSAWSNEQAQIPNETWLNETNWISSKIPPSEWNQLSWWGSCQTQGQVMCYSTAGILQAPAPAPASVQVPVPEYPYFQMPPLMGDITSRLNATC